VVRADFTPEEEKVMSDTVWLDVVRRRRADVTLPGYLAGRAPRNKEMSYPADPPRVEEIIAVMRQAGEDRHGLRVRAVIAVLWRGGLRISEALALNETDVDPGRGSVLIRHGKGDKRRQVGMDDGALSILTVGSSVASSCRSVRCSASLTARPVAEHGQRPRPVASCASSQPKRVFVDASRPPVTARPRG
jgi:hypothetical protein